MSKANAAQKNLSIDRLLNFSAVVEKGSIAAATGGDASRQALVSRQIGDLAKHFGVDLTRRVGRGLTITPEGLQLARLINEFAKGLSEMRVHVKETPVSYSIAASNSALHWLILPNLATLSMAAPSVRWKFHHESSAAICEKVTMGQMDFGLFIGSPGRVILKRRYIETVEYSLYLPPKFGHLTDVMQTLREAPLALPVGGVLRQALEVWAKKNRLPLNVWVEVDSYLQAHEILKAGAHAVVLPSLAANHLPSGTRCLQLPKPLAQSRKVWLVWSGRLMQTRTTAPGVLNALAKSLTTTRVTR